MKTVSTRAVVLMLAATASLSTSIAQASCAMDPQTQNFTPLQRHRHNATKPGVVSFVGTAQSAVQHPNETETVFAVEVPIQGTRSSSAMVITEVGSGRTVSTASVFRIAQRYLVVSSERADGKLVEVACGGSTPISPGEANGVGRASVGGPRFGGEDGTLANWPLQNAVMGFVVIVALVAWVLRYRRLRLAKIIHGQDGNGSATI